jgi:hypothetical protein
MLLSKKILAALTLMGSVNAAVLKKRIDPNTSTCDTEDHFLWQSFSILIGVPYVGEYQCDDIYNALGGVWSGFSNWQCAEENGNVRLWFNGVDDASGTVNSDLEWEFPGISFNCQDS